MLNVDADMTWKVATVRLAETEPPGPRLMLGDRATDRELLPPGETDGARVTRPEKPLTLTRDTVKVAFWPTEMFWLVGPAISVKSGAFGSTASALT